MSIDEQVERHMRGFKAGVAGCYMVESAVFESDEYQRGYNAGRAAYLAAEQAERERLSGTCPVCHGAGHDASDGAYCAACRGSGSAP